MAHGFTSHLPFGFGLFAGGAVARVPAGAEATKRFLRLSRPGAALLWRNLLDAAAAGGAVNRLFDREIGEVVLGPVHDWAAA
jgi:hypothetical protein